MKTLAHCPRASHEVSHLIIGYHDVSGGDSLLLVETPYVQLVDRFDARDLSRVNSSTVGAESTSDYVPSLGHV